ncbi:MAG: hypothetical protein FWD18_08950 [Micrococcales bacterium]|nr:hypothetical protein [Micrococcales bacterium]
MTLTLVNLTPHALRVVTDDGSALLELPAADPPARVVDSWREADPLTDAASRPVPTVAFTPGATVTDLPDLTPGVAYVVSRVTALALPDRTDLLFPFDEVRDTTGRVVGCRALARVADEEV